jgi:hypothetical protein
MGEDDSIFSVLRLLSTNSSSNELLVHFLYIDAFNEVYEVLANTLRLNSSKKTDQQVCAFILVTRYQQVCVSHYRK